MTVLARSLLRTAGLVIVVVLAASGCSLLFAPRAPAPPTPTPNEAFEGCFAGDINRDANLGEMTLVLVKTPGESFGLDACLSFVLAPSAEVLAMTGDVEADNEVRASLTGSLSTGGFLTLQLTLSPAGEVLTVLVPNNAFEADPLVPCSPAVEFGDLCPAALYPPSTRGETP